MSTSTLRLGNALIQDNMLSEDQLEVALKEQQRTGDKLGKILVNTGFITEKTLTTYLNLHAGHESLDLNTANLDASLIRHIPLDFAQDHQLVPVKLDQQTLTIATTDIHNILAFDEIKTMVSGITRITPVLASARDIATVLERYHQTTFSLPELLKQMEKWQHDDTLSNDGMIEYAEAAPAVKLVDAILEDAINRAASDIHFEPDETFVRVRYRIDGVMRQIVTFHKEYWMPLCIRIKIISGMNIAQSRKPQDGRINITNNMRDIDMRVASHPTVDGENIVIRILDKEKSIVPFDELGFQQADETLLKQVLSQPEGIIVLTGPTGSGKTTTLYSILNYLNTIDKNIMTLEEPVEYRLPMVRQTEIRDQDIFSFADGVRSIMRQNPDLVLVGEVRDEPTATMAIRAAMTGHQVFTTLHTNDAISAINRFYDLGIQSGMLSGNLLGVLGQRLIRRLCEHCKTPHPITKHEQDVLKFPDGVEVMGATGCEACDYTGYKGRISVIEILAFNDELDDLVATGASRSKIKQAALRNGFRPMAHDALAKVRAGLTTLAEVEARVNLRP